MKYIFLYCLLYGVSVNAQNNRHSLKQEKIYTYVERMPEPGFDLTGFLDKNLHYPESAKEFEGRAIVKFVVNEDGSLSDFEVVKGKELGEELLRVVRKMPKWKPGRHNGKAVNVFYTLPITIEPE